MNAPLIFNEYKDLLPELEKAPRMAELGEDFGEQFEDEPEPLDAIAEAPEESSGNVSSKASVRVGNEDSSEIDCLKMLISDPAQPELPIRDPKMMEEYARDV